uniref:Uncharacterized protein apoD9 n=1 Tax=Amycolatopsis sp. FU40 TaxID=2914159 RepID=G8EG80_9PSEU|nr:hypothetical protein [Amycolatopsis sp. FU40]
MADQPIEGRQEVVAKLAERIVKAAEPAAAFPDQHDQITSIGLPYGHQRRPRTFGVDRNPPRVQALERPSRGHLKVIREATAPIPAHCDTRVFPEKVDRTGEYSDSGPLQGSHII